MHNTHDIGWYVILSLPYACLGESDPLSFTALNAELTKFINEHGRQLDKEQFDAEYPFTI